MAEYLINQTKNEHMKNYIILISRNKQGHLFLADKSFFQSLNILNSYFFIYFYLFIWLQWVFVFTHRIFSLCCDMCDLVPQPETQSEPNALEVWRPSHWTTRHVLQVLVFLHSSDSKDREQVACSFLS